MSSLDLKQIAQRTQLPLRRLRYVLEQQVLPGAEEFSQGHRVTRHFTLFEAFGIATGGALLECGFRRELVAATLAILNKGDEGSKISGIPLYRAFASSFPAFAEIADGCRVRLSIASSPRPWQSNWYELTSERSELPPFHLPPRILTTIDLAAMRQAILKNK